MRTRRARFAGRRSGFGDDAVAALEDLMQMIRSEETTIWVPRRAKQFRESGVLKAGVRSAAPSVIAYICKGCREGIDVEPMREGE